MSEVAEVRYGTAPGRWVLLATVLGSGMAAIDATVVGIALPSIGRDFHASLEVLQWIVTSYTLTLAALLLLGGSLGDRVGRRRVFIVGVLWFTAASALCALAWDPTALIAMRSLQGVGAALLTPGSLAIIQASFAEGDRGRAIGAWSGLGGVATAAGPLLGGYLISAASWRWIFLINVPLGALVLWVGVRHVPESSDPSAHGRLDVPGAALAILTLACGSFGLIEGPARGWDDGAVLAALVAGVVGALAFVLIERRSSNPMLPLSIFKVRQFTVTNAVTFVVYGALGGILFLLPVQLQVVDGYSPLEAGVSLLPLTVIMLALSARSGRLAARIGPRLQMSVGPLVDRARPRAAGPRGDRRELRVRRAPGRRRARPRPRHDRGAAHRHGDRRAARRQRRARLGGEQRRRAPRRARRRGRPAVARRHHGRHLPARRRSSRQASVPPS